MDNFFLNDIIGEITPLLLGKTLSRVHCHGSTFFLDFRLDDGRLLAVVLDQMYPGLYLTGPSARAVAGPEAKEHSFALQSRKQLAGARVTQVFKPGFDRTVFLGLENQNLAGEIVKREIVFSLSGRSSNGYLIGPEGFIEAVLVERGTQAVGDRRPAPAADNRFQGLLGQEPPDDATQEAVLEKWFQTSGLFGPLWKKEFIFRCRGMTPAAAYAALKHDLLDNAHTPIVYSSVEVDEVGTRAMDPAKYLILSPIPMQLAAEMKRTAYPSFSQAAAAFFELRRRALDFNARYRAAMRFLTGELKRRTTVLQSISEDMAGLEDSALLKRYGDLILANLTTGRLHNDSFVVRDYFQEGEPEVEIPIEPGQSTEKAAADYYTRYQKARRALEAVAPRVRRLTAERTKFESLLASLESNPTTDQVSAVENSLGATTGTLPAGPAPGRKGRQERKQIGRGYMSSDGYEILVGKTDLENDAITFRLAGSLDLWFHAADYPGSHVVIRNPRRETIPFRTIVEAAELAAYYSKARKNGKAAVNYTQKKFVTKPPRAKPGLVRLSSFKTVLVEPRSALPPRSSQ